jgi:Patatin-like phospholipase
VADNKTAQTDSSLPLYEVLEAEFVALHGQLPAGYPETTDPTVRLKAIRSAIHALDDKRVALCISGGGIRSATFGFGILQGLARCGMLEKFHYLSTVSGGSYIGAWLSTWIRREGMGRVKGELCSPPESEPHEPQAVRNLRNHSTYLTEKSGPIFGGAWTWFSAYLWQLMAYWLMLGLSAVALLYLPRLWFALLSWRPANLENYSAIVSAACALVVILYLISDVPGLGNMGSLQGRFVTLFLIPLFGFAYAFTTWRVWMPPGTTPSMVNVVGASAAVAGLSWALGIVLMRLRSRWRQPCWKYVCKWLLFAIPLSGITGALSSFLVMAFAVKSPASAILFVPPVLALTAFITAIVFPAAMASARADDQEWMNIAGSAVFLSALLLTLATWLNTLRFVPRPGSPLQELLLWVLLVILTLLLGRVININRISQTSSYRNRLVRAYLGASNPNRRPHPLTGMDVTDNVPLANLENQRPFHVVNMALNISQGITRKTESFIMTPLHCGSARLGFRPTAEYARGVSLGTAVGISGAAIEPGVIGGRSRFKRAILMLFNARLGMWLGNPGPPGRFTWRRASPRFAISALMLELFGLATEKGSYVRLSDGGHFENLGLYEMVLRRCHYIVISDAGADPAYFFADLGNAVQKIRIDFGIPIEFDVMTIYPRSALDTIRTPGHNCAVGRIRYSVVDGCDAPDGIIIYIKPVCYGDESRDIYAYFKSSETFPQESTTDQFFSESQFESYRMLGAYTMEKLCSDCGGDFRQFTGDILRLHLQIQPPDWLAPLIQKSRTDWDATA